MANVTPVTFVPAISQEVPWHTRQHLQLLYQKLANHTVAFANLAKTAAGVTNNTTIENITSGGGGGSTTFPGLGSVNDQTGNVTYTIVTTDNGALLILNDASPVAVTLNSALGTPYFFFATNFGAGLVTFTPTSGLINGAATYTLALGSFVEIVFDGTNWKTSAVVTFPIFVDAVTPSPATDGVTTVFTLPSAPSPGLSLQLNLGGLTQYQGGGLDYTLSGVTITYVTAPAAGLNHVAWYRR